MGLENTLKDILSLKVGATEEAIRRAEDAQYEKDRASSILRAEIEAKISQYLETVQIKLPKIISNIAGIGEVICKSPETTFSFPFEMFEYSGVSIHIKHDIHAGRLEPKKGKKKEWVMSPISLLNIRGLSANCESESQYKFQAKFIFDKNTYSLRGTELQNYNTGKVIVSADNCLDLTKKYCEIAKDNFRKQGDFGLVYLPHILNLIPESIAEIYEREGIKGMEMLRKINASIEPRVKQIEVLQVSDF